jgi:hypothetical protein
MADEFLSHKNGSDGQLALGTKEYKVSVEAWFDGQGNIVGRCVVELLPGVYNKHIKAWPVLVRVK